MSLNVCAHCTSKFSVGAQHCPQCGNADYYEEGSMPKISRHGGASNKALVAEYGPEVLHLPPGSVVEAVLPEAADVEREFPGTGVVMEGVETPADGTEYVLDVEGPDDAPDGPYGAMLRAELQAECQARGLPTSGAKAELVARLAAADEAGWAEQDSDPA